jgi:CspA family cold shock protein
MLPSEPLTPSRACLAQINGGGWRAFSTSGKAALHVAKNLINGRRAQVNFPRLTGTSNEGFLSRQSGEDVFVHHTAIQSNGFRSLQEGQAVRFDVVKGPKGWQAEKVEVV